MRQMILLENVPVGDISKQVDAQRSIIDAKSLLFREFIGGFAGYLYFYIREQNPRMRDLLDDGFIVIRQSIIEALEARRYSPRVGSIKSEGLTAIDDQNVTPKFLPALRCGNRHRFDRYPSSLVHLEVVA